MTDRDTKPAVNRRMIVLVMLLSILILEGLFFIWCQTQCVQIGYEMAQESETYRSLVAMENNLRVELSRLRSPERIAEIARTQLDLELPDPERMYVLP
ncbi:MAG: cell division protein FtsL [Desulfatirhabdiaceae bacterium]